MEHPPFIAIDQEGGRVHRLPRPFTHFPAARLIGRKNDSHLAYRAGRATAVELALVGINLNFAPVLDIDSNPKNPIIGDRSFGSNPTRVSRIGMAWAEGLRAGGIIPCAKHFPGHGDTHLDSHLDLPVVDRALKGLHRRELVPFAAACRNRIESIMTAHVVFRSLDPALPATLSPKIVGGFLRRKWNFSGVVFGDDLEMRAVSDHYGDEDAALLGIAAGLDILLYCHDPARAIRTFEFLCRRAEQNERLRTRVEESYQRITTLKRRYLRTFTRTSPAQAARRLARFEHDKIVDEIQGSL